MKAQIFISSYKNDFEWLKYALVSIQKFSSGFLAPVVNVPQEDFGDALEYFAGLQAFFTARSTVIGDKRRQFLSAQIAMMEADKYCLDAEYIFQIGSDTMFCGSFTPEMYFTQGADGMYPVMCYAPYHNLKICHPDSLCWKPGTERVMGAPTRLEFMRRLPLVYRPQTLKGLRNFVVATHWGATFQEAITKLDDLDNISEANLIGSYAYTHEWGYYDWVNVGCEEVSRKKLLGFPNPVVQFWSHGGLDRPMPEDIYPEGILAGQNLKGRTPRSVIDEVLYSKK